MGKAERDLVWNRRVSVMPGIPARGEISLTGALNNPAKGDVLQKEDEVTQQGTRVKGSPALCSLVPPVSPG